MPIKTPYLKILFKLIPLSAEHNYKNIIFIPDKSKT